MIIFNKKYISSQKIYLFVKYFSEYMYYIIYHFDFSDTIVSEIQILKIWNTDFIFLSYHFKNNFFLEIVKDFIPKHSDIHRQSDWLHINNIYGLHLIYYSIRHVLLEGEGFWFYIWIMNFVISVTKSLI